MRLGKIRRRHVRILIDGERRSPKGEGSAEDAAEFISETVQSLARLAQRHDYDLLTYLLSMTRLEAEEQLKRLRRRKLS